MSKAARRRILAIVASLAAVAGTLTFAGSAAAKGDDKFAAIAVEVPRGAFGYGFNYDSRSGAETRARDECELFASRPEDCRNVVWVRNGCAAVAVIRRQNGNIRRMAWGIAEGKRKAIDRAKNAAGDGSRLLVWACSGRAPAKAAVGGGAGA
jgi:hypothetical protein